MSELERFADLAVLVGANVQRGQVVQVRAEVDQIEVVRAVAQAAYRRGARFVDARFRDPLLQRALAVHGSGEAYSPAWDETAFSGLDEVAGAMIMIVGPAMSGVLDDLDADLVSRAQTPISSAWREVEYRVNSTLIPGPHPGWATTRFPDLPANEALGRLWGEIGTVCRLDADDPVAAWQARFNELAERANRVTALGFESIRLRGPGTELEVGLLPDAVWESPTHLTERGVLHAWNLPSEEIFTSPDPTRVNGVVTLTRPVAMAGALVRDATLTFVQGEVSRITGGHGVEHLRAFVARDDGARRVGEIALVDAQSGVAKIQRPFGLVLLDENAACHLALGFGFPEVVKYESRDRVNQSRYHLDLTIGSSQVDLIGVDDTGNETALMIAGQWVLPD